MAEPLSWRNLTIGLAGLASVAAAVLVILLFARVGGVRGPKANIYVTAAEARGVLKGTNVMLSGKRIGTVEDIRFLPLDNDTLARLVIEAQVLRSALPMLRRDSYAEIRPSGTIIGAPVVDIAVGSSAAPPLAPGDTIRSRPQVAAERFLERFNALSEEVGGGLKEWRSVMVNVRSASGTFGAVRVRGPGDMAAFRALASSIVRRLDAGDGTLALLLRDRELSARASSVVGAADSIGALLNSDRGNIGRFRRDTTLIAALEATRAELAVISQALAEARGTAGRARHDTALTNELTEFRNQLDLLTEDVKRNPLRYLSF
jgi:ABC-type transporter Mla subunit MlaD